jgi:hypothetical protein
MSIYKRIHINYRHIFIKHHGPIPIDSDGRSYDIHHIDGNHQNNDPSNLRAVSLQEHYNIHFLLGQYPACQMIAHRMNLSKSEMSTLASLANQQRVDDGTHHFLSKGKEHPSYDHTVHTFKHKTSGNIVSATQYEMVKNFSVHQSNLIEVISGKRKSVNGWSLA